MNNALFNFARPKNEPVRAYDPCSSDRDILKRELNRLSAEVTDIPLIIGGKEIRTGNTGTVVMPHDHSHVLATYHKAGDKEVHMAIEAALDARKAWAETSWIERVSVTLKVAELIEKKYRHTLNAVTMLGQSKNVFQAEIDASCETIDFLRFNAHYVTQLYNDQPVSESGIVNRIEYRPLEGFVFSLTPFNFTSIAANLNLAPVLMGNVTIWKPATTALLSNYFLMKIFMEAGVPAGVINFLPGQGARIGAAILSHPMLAGIHFTGSTSTFNHLWKTVGENLEIFRSYPKLVGETGGKDFVVVHSSADAVEVATALVRGAFEYQGQKCSAASRAYIPESLWPAVHATMKKMMDEIHWGDPVNFGNFMNAVIDEPAFDRILKYIELARSDKNTSIIFGGHGDKQKGYFIEPTVIKVADPHFITMEEEIFGPVLTVYVYPDTNYDAMLELVDNTSPYALTGSVFASDRKVLANTCARLRYAAGNFYYNDKPTGAVVGQQPFGGARASGTNDKAGSVLNLIRWTSPRTIKETLIPPGDFKYPFMNETCG
ncbi:MAG: L-glutamate gamma-semialdehyde dehydrogenase [Bacteroidia bacterium]|nr:L-glutamate gamma-semialdehyde dehydrogenase [Bacteroidales bacterium]MDD3961195.1 L-glutamate gamma-semialdehyde dehydrogenase [Bacteroidales bacterium]MDY0284619.1 L-glutamate gamma-semialdehyde dehydrogenase [Bacteroidales bacterium]NCD40733.1 L-glutamate gamma-semialdehyde dehydrogenase [Bacteroidia bacterium]